MHKEQKEKERAQVERGKRRLQKLESHENELLEKIKNSQQLEAEMYRKLENSIDQSITAQRDRLLAKKKRNLEVRKQALYHIKKPSKSVER